MTKITGAPDAQFMHAKSSVLRGRTVLQIVPKLESGGVERTTLDIAEILAKSGARPLVLSEGGRLVPELQARGGIFIPFPASTKNPIKIFSNASRLSALISSEGVDLVHARSRAPAWSALMAAKARHVPFVTTYHGAYSASMPLKSLYNSVMARGDVVIANSHFTADLIIREHRFAHANIRVIPRGVDFELFSPELVNQERIEAQRLLWGVNAGEPVVLLAGRLTAWKGQMLLIEAAALLQQQGPLPFQFILAGDKQRAGHFYDQLQEAIRTKGLEKNIRLVGHCADMPAAFMAATVAVMPSLAPEAFGRVAVEAQAMGCPVVVADHGAVAETVLAPPEVTLERRTGWRVPVGDAEALAQAIHEAAHMPMTERLALTKRAQKHVEENFSLSQMVAKTLDVYAALLGG